MTRLLVSANRAAPARQRSLDAAVDWSYQLLHQPEQRVFRYLSMFPGPFSLNAAEAVAGADAGPAVLHLVDCSLLVPPAAGPTGGPATGCWRPCAGSACASSNRRGGAGGRGRAGRPCSHWPNGRAALARRDTELSAARWLDAEDATVHQGLAWALDHDPPSAFGLALALRRGGCCAAAGCRAMPCCSAPPGTRTRATMPGAPLRSGWASSRAERPISSASS